MNLNLAIATGLPSDLVPGRDWFHFCRDSLPQSRFVLSSRVLDLPLQVCLFVLFIVLPQFVQDSSQSPSTTDPARMEVDNDLDIAARL
jgi:hypothetical protein